MLASSSEKIAPPDRTEVEVEPELELELE